MKTEIQKYVLGLAMVAIIVAQNKASAETATSQPPLAKLTLLNINNSYVPEGNKSIDDSYVIVSGTYNNGCYKWSNADVKGPNQNSVIEIRSFALVNQGMCIMVLIPFTQKVTIGKLDHGEYTVRFINGDGTYFDKPLIVD